MGTILRSTFHCYFMFLSETKKTIIVLLNFANKSFFSLLLRANFYA